MTLMDGCYSLKLECALRNLGFVEIDWRVVAHAGLYFIRPVGSFLQSVENDDLLGFQIQRSEHWKIEQNGLHLGWPITQSAKQAIDLALNLS
jgi:hypothetical protein